MYLTLAAVVIIATIVFIDNAKMKEDIEALEFKIKDLRESLERTKHFVKLHVEESDHPTSRCKGCEEEESYWKPGICINCSYRENDCDGCDRCIACGHETIEVPDNYDEYYGEDDQEEEEEKSEVSCIFSEECDDREDCSQCIWNDAYIPDTSDQSKEIEEIEELDPSHYICPCDDCELGPCNEESPCERFIKWKDSFYPVHVTAKCLKCKAFGRECKGCEACGQCNIDGSCPEDGSVCTEQACGFTAVDCVADECDHRCERR